MDQIDSYGISTWNPLMDSLRNEVQLKYVIRYLGIAAGENFVVRMDMVDLCSGPSHHISHSQRAWMHRIQCAATWGRPTSRQSFWAVFDQIYIKTHMHKLLFTSFRDQNSDIALRFSDLDFLKRSNNLAITTFSRCTMTFDHLILNVCSTPGIMRSDNVPNMSEIEQYIG